MRRDFPLLLLIVVALQTGCVTPIAVRSLSAGLVQTQRVYALSLQSYFAAVEKFADAQVRIAEMRIDAVTSQMNRALGQRAAADLARAATPAERQKIIDQLVRDIAGNTGADLPLKNKIAASVASLKQKDQELAAAYAVILAASEKLDEYVRLKKADEVAINTLAQTVGVNSQKITSIVDAITKLSADIIQSITKMQS
jgi:hypothetical protein